MSDVTRAERRLTSFQLSKYLVDGERFVGNIGATTSGVLVVLERRNGQHWLAEVTDAFFSVVRRGQVAISTDFIGSALTDITLDPPLTGKVSDYLVFLSFSGADAPFTPSIFIRATLTSLSNLRIRSKSYTGTSNVADTGTISATDIDQVPAGGDGLVDVNPHDHFLTSDPHSHVFAFGSLSFTVNWMVIAA